MSVHQNHWNRIAGNLVTEVLRQEDVGKDEIVSTVADMLASMTAIENPIGLAIELRVGLSKLETLKEEMGELINEDEIRVDQIKQLRDEIEITTARIAQALANKTLVQ